jgi:hypothetical protein
MPTPSTPLPAVAETWIARAKYLRWLDALAAWVVLLGLAMELMPELSARLVAALSGVLLLGAIVVPPLRLRWRPISAWTGVAVSRTLRPGDQAWFVRDGRADRVLLTGRRGLRMSIAEPGFGATETITVRRTRVLLVPS